MGTAAVKGENSNNKKCITSDKFLTEDLNTSENF